MKTPSIIFAAMLSLFLLFGCAIPWEQQQQAPSPLPSAAPNAAPSITSPAATQQPPSTAIPGHPVLPSNETQPAPPAPQDMFANLTPRNISDNIADGQFRIMEMPSEPLRIYAINDSNADSILVQKGSFYMLVDAGDSTQVQSFLDSQNITRLNVVVATRDDAGAIGGIADILGEYAVDEFWDNNIPPQSQEYSSLLSLVRAKGTTIKHPQAGDRLFVQGLKIDVLNPQSARLLGNPDTDAIVLKLSTNAFCALLLNPTVQDRENAIISTGKDLRCDVATYFKHGEARPAASLLINSYAQPKDAIISVGPNDLGLPSQTTLTWLSLKNIAVWRTDTQGTIAVSTDGLGNYTIGRYNATNSTFISPVTR